jgi:hypothetical protein
MTSSIDEVCAPVRDLLADLSSEDQRLFLEEQDLCLSQRANDGQLLDQLCCLRVVLTRLSQGYALALARFEEGLEAKASMSGGWRNSVTRKTADEYESPMPWLHPFKLARDELEPLERRLQEALASGEPAATDPGLLREVLDKYDLKLPLSSPIMEPKFGPGAKKATGEGAK